MQQTLIALCLRIASLSFSFLLLLRLLFPSSTRSSFRIVYAQLLYPLINRCEKDGIRGITDPDVALGKG